MEDNTAPAAVPSLGRGKQIVFTLILLALCAGLCELMARLVIPESLNVGRRILLGREDTHLVRMQNTVGQAYLLYTSAPNYTHPRFGQQNNAQGYRGSAVPLDRQPDVLRIVCLGGSTTYGTGVGRPHQAYPAVLEELLRENLPPGYRDVEVINGGLTWGTSAEILTHYHFKYHYYRPDLVIINTGGNDAQGYTLPYYHPDNSNWRQPMVNLPALPRRWRWLAHSRLMAMLMLNVFYSQQLHGGQFVVNEGRRPDAPWFTPGGKMYDKPTEIPLEQLSFLHNLRTLIRSIQADQGRVLLVPFRAAPGGYAAKPFELSQIDRHERILRELAQKYRTGYAPFSADIISAGNWVDHCHLNVEGERQKAAHILEHVLNHITQGQNVNPQD